MSRATTNHDDLPPLCTGGRIPNSVRAGTVIDRWACPCCDRTIDVVHRPGRPRLYCSHACRQRAYRWRREHRAHAVSTPAWPVEGAAVPRGKPTHALRTSLDPMSRRRDRRGREVTVCGVLARPHGRARDLGLRVPFVDAGAAACRTCAALVRARPLGLVPPGAMPPPWPPGYDAARSLRATVDALREIDDHYPLDPGLRRLLTTLWAA